MALKEFFLNESLDWNVTTYREWNSYLSNDVVTNEDLVEVIKGNGKCSITGDDDGPEFRALRNHLEAEGYIQCERGWWNGDRVLRGFKLNGVSFRKNEQFCCGSAMKHHLKSRRRISDYKY